MQKGEVLDTMSRVKLPEVKDGEGRELGASGSKGHRSTSTRRDELGGLLFSRET